MHCEVSFHKQPDPVNDLPDGTDIKLGNQQLSVCSIPHLKVQFQSVKYTSVCQSSLKVYEHKKGLVAKTDHKQSGRLQRAGKRSVTADTMVAYDGHYSNPDKTTEEGDEHSEKCTF